MTTLVEEIKDKLKAKNLSELSIKQYLQVLRSLNGRKDPLTFAFLRDTDAVDAKLEDYKSSTQYGFLGAIVGVLNLFMDRPTLKRARDHYASKLASARQNRIAEAKDEKTDKERKNWIKWELVLKKRDELKSEVMGFMANTELTKAEYNTLLKLVVLMLYTEIPPRRNDYLYMVMVPECDPAKTDKTKNYYCVASDRFIYNRFKTVRTEGQQIETIKDDKSRLSFTDVLELYTHHHPKYDEKSETHFLATFEGEPINKVNSITRILNSIFGRAIGSSALRHIYLTDKYGETVKKMEADAKAMAHSSGTQRAYIKFD